MTNFDVAKLLEPDEIAVSKVRVTVLDRRTHDVSDVEIFIPGESFHEYQASRDLDRVGFELVRSDLLDTQWGKLNIEMIFEAFAKAEEEK